MTTLPKYETLLCELEGAVATVTLNRPKVLNALSTQVLEELDAVFAELTGRAEIRAILLTGSGEKAFAAGADIREFSSTDAASGEGAALRGQAAFDRVANCGKPVIALVNGFALGGGCELALACTLRLAAENARFGQAEIRLGLIPGFGGTQRLTRLVGPAAALKLILTGEMIAAAEALRIGLVDEVIPSADLPARGRALANQIAAQPPLAVAAAIEAVQNGAELPLEDALALEAQLFGRLSATEDKREGVQAFIEKRPADFKGR
jgi:enoyl-CoA hydratase